MATFTTANGGDKLQGRERLAEFWRRQRAAMEAFKLRADCVTAIPLFEQALELDPDHEDSLYYLANCLADIGDVEGALARLEQLIRVNTLSQRGNKRWGTLRAAHARNTADLDAAAERLERAGEINPEETGVSLALGEVEVLRGRHDAARQRLEWVVRTNPQAAEAFFVLAYLDWVNGDSEAATARLQAARAARGEDWLPPGVVAEGEVKRRMHEESTPFEDVYNAWDGTPDPPSALAGLQQSGRPGSVTGPWRRRRAS